MAQDQVTFGLVYSFPRPEPWRVSPAALYAGVLDRVSWAEGLGLRSAWLTEHHFSPDGYTPRRW